MPDPLQIDPNILSDRDKTEFLETDEQKVGANTTDQPSQKTEASPEAIIPETAILKNFWDGVVTGHYEPLTDEQIDQLIDQQFDRYPAMTELTVEEIGILKRDFASSIRRVTNSEKRKILSENPLALGYDKDHPSRIILADLQSERIDEVEIAQTFHGEEKISLLKDCKLYNDQTLVIYGNSKAPLESQGNSNIDRYWMDNENIHTLLSRIHQKCGEHLKALDIGGMVGRAMHGIKDIDPDVETYNLTVDEDPAMYPVDHLLVCPAEHMPKSFEGQMNLIFSDISFRYHAFPDISLENVVKSLAVGGEAFIEFETERSSQLHENPEGFKIRIRKIFEWIKSLENSGIIKTNIASPDIDLIAQGGGLLKIHIERLPSENRIS